jgi:hypothetical protein
MLVVLPYLMAWSLLVTGILGALLAFLAHVYGPGRATVRATAAAASRRPVGGVGCDNIVTGLPGLPGLISDTPPPAYSSPLTLLPPMAPPPYELVVAAPPR